MVNKKNIQLVLIHGFAANKFVWGAFANQLAQDYTVHAVDLSGYGERQAISADSLEILAQQICAQITAPAIWVGWSLGGLVARYLAHIAPAQTQGVITIASNPKFVANEEWSCGIDAAAFDALHTLFASQPAQALTRFFSLQGPRFDRETQKKVLQLKKQAAQLAPMVLLRDLHLLRSTDLRVLTRQLTIPQLNIFGAQDRLVPVAVVEQLKDLCPTAQNATIYTAAHLPFLSHMSECLTHINKFIHGSITLY